MAAFDKEKWFRDVVVDKVSCKKKVSSRFKVIVLLYIAHFFFKKEVTRSPSEVCKLERKKVFGGFETKVFFMSAEFRFLYE